MSDASQSRANMVMVTLAAALVVPRIEQATGVKLTTDDVAALIAAAPLVWHTVASTFVRYFPPPSPAEPAKGTQ